MFSASSEACDRNAPTNANQIKLQTSRMGEEHRPIRHQLPARLSFRQGLAVEIDPAAMQPLAQPCPRCGGRMFVIETFEAGCQPRHRPTTPVVAIRIDAS
jgi:hypothetical protein